MEHFQNKFLHWICILTSFIKFSPTHPYTDWQVTVKGVRNAKVIALLFEFWQDAYTAQRNWNTVEIGVIANAFRYDRVITGKTWEMQL